MKELKYSEEREGVADKEVTEEWRRFMMATVAAA